MSKYKISVGGIVYFLFGFYILQQAMLNNLLDNEQMDALIISSQVNKQGSKILPAYRKRYLVSL
ncbi:hypothetical protein DsansV1_C01g0002991 [Dioscorea sansibarensis]